MENTKNACVGYAILWIATIALRWVISDPEGTLSDLLTYWIVHPVAIAVATGYIASEGMTWKKWMLPIGIAFFYALIDLFTGSLQYAINNHQSFMLYFPSVPTRAPAILLPCGIYPPRPS